jgi:hypothetical protein
MKDPYLERLRLDLELDGEELATLLRIREDVNAAIFAKRERIRCADALIERARTIRGLATEPRGKTPGKPAGREGHAIPADHRGISPA